MLNIITVFLIFPFFSRNNTQIHLTCVWVPPQEPLMYRGTEPGPKQEASGDLGAVLPRGFMLCYWEYASGEFEDISEDGIQVASQTSTGILMMKKNQDDGV